MRIATCVMVIVFAVFTFSPALTTAEEKIYRWVDENGVVHFGDRSEGNKEAEVVKVQKNRENTASENADPIYAAESGEPSYAQQQRDARAENQKKAAKEKKDLAAGCDFHNGMIAKLEPMTRVIIEKEDGSVVRMDDNDRLEKLNVSKDYVAANCK